MKVKTKAPDPKDYYCKLRIDQRTIILVRSEASYKQWMSKYPKATKVE